MSSQRTLAARDVPQDESGAGEYFEVSTGYGCYEVDQETAARVARQLSRWWRPRWLKFVDRTGARIWVRASLVDSVTESTESTRGRADRHSQALRRETRSRRDWSLDDDD